jgi:hypothetical protein
MMGKWHLAEPFSLPSVLGIRNRAHHLTLAFRVHQSPCENSFDFHDEMRECHQLLSSPLMLLRILKR